MTGHGKATIGGILLLAGAAALALHWQAVGLTPIWTAIGLLAIVGVPSALWLLLGIRPAGSRRLPRIFWLGILILLFGLVVAQPWYTVTKRTTPIRLTVGELGISSLDRSMKPATLPAKLRQELRIAFPGLKVGDAWKIVYPAQQPAPMYEMWLRRPGQNGFTLQVLSFEGLHIENQQMNSVYTPRPGRELPLRQLEGEYQTSAGVLGPYVFPGYLLYLAPGVAQSWTVDRYTGDMGGGMGW